MIWAVAVDVAPQHLFSGPYRATWKLYSGDVLIATGATNGAQPPPRTRSHGQNGAANLREFPCMEEECSRRPEKLKADTGRTAH